MAYRTFFTAIFARILYYESPCGKYMMTLFYPVIFFAMKITRFGKAAHILLLIMIFSIGSSWAMASFSDVLSDNVYYDAVTYAETQGIVSGYPDGSYKPDHLINRAEFTKIIVGAALDYNSSQDPSGYDIYALIGIPYSDAISGEWYVPYLRKATENDVISGYPDGTFKPADNINFAEASKILVRGFGYETTPTNVWYQQYVEKLAELHAIPTTIQGFDQKITRGEMAEMIYRIKTGLTDKESVTYELLAGETGASGGSGGNQTPPVSGDAPRVGSCQIYPSDNAWNRDVSADPIDPNSASYISYIGNLGGNQFLHADFGGGGEYGIPYIIVGADEPKVPVDFVWYPEESDPGPYPIPASAPVENGSDAHVLAVDEDTCMLYELYAASFNGSVWEAGSGAIFDLTSNLLRPEGWTSADAAGLPIFPGLVRYDEVTNGSINHALRVTFSDTQNGYIHPATHFASDNSDSGAPPMGLRLRLRADYDISGYTGQARVILEALKKYGLIVADNGSNWYISGSQDTRWDDEDLNQLKDVPGSAFEVVKTGEIIR